MTICCPKSIKALAIRVTRTDACGIPEADTVAQSRITTAGFVSLTLTPNIETGNEVTIRRGDGTLCVTNKDKDQLKWFDLELLACGVPLPLLEMLLGLTLLTDGADTVGGVLPSKTAQLENDPRQVELWSRNKDADGCAAGNTAMPYVQWLLPLSSNWQLSGTIEYGIGALEITLSGIAEESPGFEPSIAAEWDAGQITAIQNGGPLAWKCVDAVPTTADCAYDAAASGS